jgi:pilus assembly protein CpaE
MSSRVLLVSANGPAEAAVRSALEEGGNQVTVVGDAGAAARETANHQLIVLDAADDKAVVRLCHDVRKAADGAGYVSPPIVAVTQSGDVEQRVRLLEAGADDVLIQPFDPRELEALVDALLLRAAPVAGQAGAAAADAVGGTSQLATGQVIVFVAAKGGVGSTTLAVNSALALAEATRTPLALVDLDFQHGQVATLLDVAAPATTADLARDEQSLDDLQVLRQIGVVHPAGLYVYAAPHRPDLAADVTHEQSLALVAALRRAFPIVIVDAGSVFDWRALALMDTADRTVVTVAPEIPTLRVLQGALEMINESEGLASRAIFVLNNTYARQTVTAEQIQEHLGVPIAIEIPYDPELYLTAANEGQPVLLAAPRSAPAGAIRQMAAMLRGHADGAAGNAEGDKPQPKRRGLGGLLRRD